MTEQLPTFPELLEILDMIEERTFQRNLDTSQEILSFYEEHWESGEAMLGMKLNSIKRMMEFEIRMLEVGRRVDGEIADLADDHAASGQHDEGIFDLEKLSEIFREGSMNYGDDIARLQRELAAFKILEAQILKARPPKPAAPSGAALDFNQ